MPSKAKLPVEALDGLPRVSVTLTDESVYLTRYDPRGKPGGTHLVRAGDVANAFNVFGASTGLLPDGVLFWQTQYGQARVGVWMPPGWRTLIFGRGIAPLTIPLPGLVFVGRGRDYWVFAAKARPARPADRLYLAPLPNVFGDGRVCAGSVPFPVAGAETMAPAVRLFFESEFNYDLADGRLAGVDNAVKFLRSLAKARAFPLDKLVPHGTIGSLIAQAAEGRDEP